MVDRRLRILWLSHFVPFPPKGGCFQRSYNLIKRVAAVHDVHLVAMRHKAATHPPEELANAREELLKHCRSVDIVDITTATQGVGLPLRALRGMLTTATPFNVSVYQSAEMRRVVRARCDETAFDVAHFDTIGLAQYLADVGPIPAVMTHHGAESHMIRRRIPREPNLLKKAYFVLEWLALRRYERLMCPRFDANIVMSEDDGRLMSQAAPGATYTPVENGVDTAYFTPVERHAGRALVFAGRLDQYSNRDGILYFVAEVWPALKQRYPEVVLHVIGSNPPEALRTAASADGQIRVHGFVPDVRPYFAMATAAICPLRDGGGTRLKVLDALAQGMPLVSTEIGCEGLAVTPERDVLIANSPVVFVDQIGRVFDDDRLQDQLAVRARGLVEDRYSWESIGERLIALYEGVARHPGKSLSEPTSSGHRQLAPTR